MILLEEKSRHLDIVTVFETYLKNIILSSNFQKPILDSHIEIYSKSLQLLVIICVK